MSMGDIMVAAAEPTEAEIEIARTLYDRRRVRSEHFPDLELTEPSWDMLLFLFINQHRLVTTGELCDASCAPRTTGLRYIARLSEIDLVVRSFSDTDARVHHVQLSPRATEAMRLYLAAPTCSEVVGQFG
jgi:DNA-binding MarR family transcriptional regulator